MEISGKSRVCAFQLLFQQGDHSLDTGGSKYLETRHRRGYEDWALKKAINHVSFSPTRPMK